MVWSKRAKVATAYPIHDHFSTQSTNENTMKRLLLILLLLPLAAHGQNVRITNPTTSPGQITDIAYFAAAVTPADGSNLANPATRGLWVGGAGNVKVDCIGGGTVTFNTVAAGTWLKVAAVKVYATGTTATNIVALY
jgi:hypothetical protein